MSDGAERRSLWAPWRIEYIRRAKDGADAGCFLCRAGATKGSSDENHRVVARGRFACALMNRYPYSPGHLLIAPYRHVGDLGALTVDERHEMLDLVVRSQAALRGAMAPHGFNFGCNLGRVAGAAIEDHVHFHVVPRWLGDTNFMPVLANTDCIPQALDETAKLLRQHWPKEAAT